jgi:hypothetical protein
MSITLLQSPRPHDLCTLLRFFGFCYDINQKESMMWKSCPSSCLSACDPVSETIPFFIYSWNSVKEFLTKKSRQIDSWQSDIRQGHRWIYITLFTFISHCSHLHHTDHIYSTLFTFISYCSHLHHTVHIYITMFTSTLHCSHLHHTDHIYITLFTFTSHCSHLHHTVHIYITMFTSTSHCSHIHHTDHIYITLFTFISHCSHLHHTVHIYIALFTFISHCLRSRVCSRLKPSDFSGWKNPQHAFLWRGSKIIFPMSQLWDM